jgi:hypothetical protein
MQAVFLDIVEKAQARQQYNSSNSKELVCIKWVATNTAILFFTTATANATDFSCCAPHWPLERAITQ